MAVPGNMTAQAPAILGTWKFDLKQGNKKQGPRTVIVRADSSASYGTETVRWRIVGDSLALALGGEWVNYRLKLEGQAAHLVGRRPDRAGHLRPEWVRRRPGPTPFRSLLIPTPSRSELACVTLNRSEGGHVSMVPFAALRVTKGTSDQSASLSCAPLAGTTRIGPSGWS